MKKQNINELISIIKNCAYQDNIIQEIINQSFDKYKSKLKNYKRIF